MPIYEYQCPKCGTFEATQRITENALTKCPTCKSKVKKLISNTSFQLKGTGWYITDYARKGQTNGDAKKDGDGKAPGAESRPKSDSSKSESKGEASSKTEKSSSTSTSSTPAST